MNENNEKIEHRKDDDESAASISFRGFYTLCLSKWSWFALSVALCLGAAGLYLLHQTPVYSRSTLVQIRDDQHGGTLNSELINQFADFGAFSSSADVFNELVAIRSPRLIEQVIDNLDLDVSYTCRSGLRTLPVYGNKLPFVVEFLDAPLQSKSMEMNITGGSPTASLSHFVLYTETGDKETSESTVTFNTASIDTLSTPVGRIVVRPNARYAGVSCDMAMKVSYTPAEIVVERIENRLTTDLADKNATIINLTYTDSSPRRAEDILNNLVEVYNQSWVDDRNRMARETSRFINQRLESLESELSDVDSDISSFKSQNLLPDVDEASTLYLQQATKTSDEILSLNNRLSMARYVHDYLDNPAHATSLMPANSGTGAAAIDAQIREYNTLMIERNALASSSSDSHPRVKQYDETLAGMRAAVLTAIDNQIAAITTSIHNLERSQASATARIAANPRQARYLMSVGRQQKVKESLYLFLLQKREENELSQTFVPYNTRLLQEARGERTPVSPRGSAVLVLAFIIGLLIPLCTLYVRELFDTSVRSRRDVENLRIPFLGEIPYVGRKSRFGRTKDTDKGILVAHGKTDTVNESFRLLRSNLEFMLRSEQDKGARVLMVTSAIPSSGKTFVSMNLAATLALKNKKVLLVDIDLRRHSMSDQLAGSSRQGVSAYLAGNGDVQQYIIHDIDGHNNLDFMAAGAVPPNPAELIGSRRMYDLLARARDLYDVVILDCPPTEAVEDARAVTPLVDITLYVVRIGNLERSFLPALNRMYTENRYTRMTLVLNGADTSRSYGYSYSYGYGHDRPSASM